MENDCLAEKLCKDTSDRPNINGFGVNSGPDQNLWRAIRSGGHVVSDIASVDFLSGEVHVSQFEFALFVHENVLRFEVSVENVSRVHKVDCYQQLVHDELYHLLCDFHLGLDKSAQVKFHILHDQVDLVESSRVFDRHNALQCDDVLMVEKFYTSNKLYIEP